MESRLVTDFSRLTLIVLEAVTLPDFAVTVNARESVIAFFASAETVTLPPAMLTPVISGEMLHSISLTIASPYWSVTAAVNVVSTVPVIGMSRESTPPEMVTVFAFAASRVTVSSASALPVEILPLPEAVTV